MKLIRLNKDVFIITNDEPIGIGDFFYVKAHSRFDINYESGIYKRLISKSNNEEYEGWINGVFSDNTGKVQINCELQYCSKITHSTEILDGDEYGACFTAVKQLNPDEVNELIYENDLHLLLSDFYVFITNGEVCDHTKIDEFLETKNEWEVTFTNNQLVLCT